MIEKAFVCSSIISAAIGVFAIFGSLPRVVRRFFFSFSPISACNFFNNGAQRVYGPVYYVLEMYVFQRWA